MRVLIEQEDAQELVRIARQYGVDSEKLWEAYQEVMKSNFYEDLCDIARENEEELKGE